MNKLKEKLGNTSLLIENQFPDFVVQENSKFISFLSLYYESQETKYQPLDIASNIIDYYNIGYYTKTELTEYSSLTSDVLISDTTISVKSTAGFPEKNGYIQINNEYIFYRTKTSTQFLNCVRGTSALVLEQVPETQLVLNSSALNTDTNGYVHEHLIDDKVINISYYFTAEFFRRVKSEIAPTISDNLVENLNISSFLKQIKSFYSAKGSLNAHKILFRILFNDKRLKIRAKSRGKGAKITLVNNGGKIGYVLPDNTIIGSEIVNPGSGYDYRTEGGILKYPPLIEVLGSGTGEKDPVTNIVPKTAIVEVTGINSQGQITSINIKNRGENYEGPIVAKVRERSFDQDQIVRNVSGTGIARVENWDSVSEELILYDVVGYFRVDDEIVADTGEKPSIFISKAYPVTDINKSGNPSVEILPIEPTIEFPKENTLKPSSAGFYRKRVIKCELVKNSIYRTKSGKAYLPQLISFVQGKDEIFGVKGVTIESSMVTYNSDNIFTVEIETNSDFKDLHLPPSTKLTIAKSSITSSTSSFILTVDNASGFPTTNGFIYINKNIIEYESRSGNQFFGCKYSGTSTINLFVGDNVYSYGRKKHNTLWQTGQSIKSGEYRFYGENLYISKNSGTTKTTAPTHTSGVKSDGTFGVKWEYVGKNIFGYFVTGYIEGNFTDTAPPEFRIVGLTSDVEIEDSGALYSSQTYEFVDKLIDENDDPTYTSWNVNRTQTTVSNGNTIGIDSLYEYEDKIYISSSGIPAYLNSVTASDVNRKNATNQKLVKRLRKNTLSNRTSSSETKKGIGITVDGVEIQSLKGNVINYGSITEFRIESAGDYVIPIASNNTSFDVLKYPVLNIDGYNSNPIKNTSGTTLYYLNGRINTINTDYIPTSYLEGFSFAPRVVVENNNPFKSSTFTNTQINYTNDTITISAHSFETGDKVRYSNPINVIGGLIDGEYYYVRKIDNNTVSLFYTKDDAILNILPNKVNFTVIPNTVTFTATLKTDNANPIDFEPAEIDVSFSNGKIDRLIVKNTGKGYIVAPTIKFVGGGKDFSGSNAQYETLPFKNSSGQSLVVFRGGLISAQNYTNSEWDVIPLQNEIGTAFDETPDVTVDYGSGASATAYTANGVVTSIELNSNGQYYFTQPLVQISGVGTNARAEAIIDTNGALTEIKILNGGTGYFIAPVVNIISNGSGSIVSAKLKSWTFNIANRFTSDINNYGGYVYQDQDNDTKGALNAVELNISDLAESLDDRQYLIVKTTSNLNSHYGITNTQHSPIIGWAYDGHPIYGKYGYSSKYNSSSSIVELTSGWNLKTTRVNGPAVADYPLGSFIEDYEKSSSSSLDEHNGRFCVTPEFPDGVYAYFATDAYPYFIGPKYVSTVDLFNINGCRRNDKIPYFYQRINDELNTYYPAENKRKSKTILQSNLISKGTVDSVIIEDGGQNYRVGDKLIVNNSLTYGSGFTAFVSRVTGLKISSYEFVPDSTKIIFNTVSPHGLSTGDYLYFDYVKDNSYKTVVLSGINQSSLVSQSSAISVGNSSVNTLYHLNLNAKNNYKLIEANHQQATFSYDRENLNPFYDTSIEIEVGSGPTDGIKLDASKLPSVVYLHINGKVFEVTTSISQLIGEQRVIDVIGLTSFAIDRFVSFIDTNLSNIFYTAKSYSATGSIADVVIVNSGSGYKKLPEIVGVSSVTGNGAIIQANSDSIGKIRNLEYVSVGDEFTSTRNVKYDVNLYYTAKVINNFQIDEIQVISGGTDYVSTDSISVNGSLTFGKYQIVAQAGTITEVKILDGGYNLKTIPEILVNSLTGNNATLSATIIRKEIFANDYITFNSILSTAPKAKIVAFDRKSSTIEFSQIQGEVKEGDIIYSSDGNVYGKIVSIRRAKASAKSSPYVNFASTFLNNYGFLNDNSQRILDSKFYQDWSYVIASGRNTKEWMGDVLQNTHASGFKAFGKNILEKRKSVFNRPEDIFKSFIKFTVNLNNILDLKLKTTPCRSQKIFLPSVASFQLGNYVFGTTTETLGVVEEISDSSLMLSVVDGPGFITGESVVIVSNAISINSAVPDNQTTKSLIFVNGILQQPVVSYSISESLFVPRFPILPNDEIVGQFLNTEFDYLDPINLTSIGEFALTKNGQSFNPAGGLNKNKLIISIAGAIQNPDNFTLSGDKVVLSSTPEQLPTSRTFALYHNNLQKITFSGSSVGTTYMMNVTPTGNCRLLIAYSSLDQTHLLTDYTIINGNQIQFSESVELSNIFGWYFNEDVSCEVIDTSAITLNTINGVYKICRTNNYTQFIESNNQKNPNNFYEFDKELIDGTVYTSGNTVYGFDTRFKYSNPEYSTSYVDVLDDITFNGINVTYKLTHLGGIPYKTVQRKGSIVVYINNQILDPEFYEICDDTITFANVYPSGTNCGIIDFRSSYLTSKFKFTRKKGANLDKLNVAFNSDRKTFNLSDLGVPLYVNNVGDIFVIRNGVLQKPNSSHHTINDNKITFEDAPDSDTNMNLLYFNRQLSPQTTKNIILDDLICPDGIRTQFPLTINGETIFPDSSLDLFVIRDGIVQNPEVDYTVSDCNIIFSDALDESTDIKIYYFNNGSNNNVRLSHFYAFDGVRKEFGITKNYLSKTPLNTDNLIILRNGVYQYPKIDYQVEGSKVTFDVAPLSTDKIFTFLVDSDNVEFFSTNYTWVYGRNSSSYLVNAELVGTRSGNLSLNHTTIFDRQIVQISSQVVELKNSPNINLSSESLLVFIDGVLQEDNTWTYNNSTKQITFSESVSVLNNEIHILWIKSSNVIDTITMSDGVFTYALTDGGSSYTPTSADSLFVTVNGVVQEPDSSYTISGTDIIFTQVTDSSVVYIRDLNSSSLMLVDAFKDEVDGIKTMFKLQSNYSSFDSTDVDDLIVIRNSIVQNPTQDFTGGNGYITFTTAPQVSDNIVVFDSYQSSEIAITSVVGNTLTLASAVPSGRENDLILFINGVPQIYETDFTYNSSTSIDLINLVPDSGTTMFAILFKNLDAVDSLDNCPDGVKTQFRIAYNGVNFGPADILSDADVILSKDGVVQQPGIDYTISTNRRFINFTSAPMQSDDIFMIKMYGNEFVSLTSVGGSSSNYNLSTSITNQEALVISSNGVLKLLDYDFTFDSGFNNKITLSVPNDSASPIFAFKFVGSVRVLDDINTPYDSSRTMFNMFLEEENFVPIGTIDNDTTPSPTSILVSKNGKVLDPGVDYTLSGTILSRISFTTPPSSNDVILIKTVGSFDKLDSITTGFGGNTYYLKKGGLDYYPNAIIERPREHENQILVIKDGYIQNPLKDYYIDNNKLIFNSNITASKLVILDFRGIVDDVKVDTYSYQVKVGDLIQIAGESTRRKVTNILSPTVMQTESYTGSGYSGFSGTFNGQSVTVTSGGTGYPYPTILRTKSSGTSAKLLATPVRETGYNIPVSSITIQNYGTGITSSTALIPSTYAYVVRQQQLSTNAVRKGTKLSSNITEVVESIPLATTSHLIKNPPTITIISSTGSGAILKPYVYDNRIRKVEIINSGIGYNELDIVLTVSGGGGSGCVLEPVLDAMGSLTEVKVQNPGVGYDTFRVFINGELIEYTDFTSSEINGCTRGVVGIAIPHTQDTIVYSDNYL